MTATPQGYVEPPGSGPDGETCRTCGHSAKKPYNVRRIHWGCTLYDRADAWSRGRKTDIRLGSQACRKWARRLT